MTPHQRLKQFIDRHGLQDTEHGIKVLKNRDLVRQLKELMDDCMRLNSK